MNSWKKHVGSGAGLTSVQRDRQVRPADFLPVGDLTAVNRADLGVGQGFHRIRLVHDDGQRVDGDRDLDRNHAVFLGGRVFLFLHVREELARGT